MFLWDCQDLWMILGFCDYLIFTKMQPTMDFLILNMDHKMAFAPKF